MGLLEFPSRREVKQEAQVLDVISTLISVSAAQTTVGQKQRVG
jgi:hypothetical protein